MIPHLLHRVVIFGPEQILPSTLDQRVPSRATQPYRAFRSKNFRVHVHADIDVGPDRLADSANVLRRCRRIGRDDKAASPGASMPIFSAV